MGMAAPEPRDSSERRSILGKVAKVLSMTDYGSSSGWTGPLAHTTAHRGIPRLAVECAWPDGGLPTIHRSELAVAPSRAVEFGYRAASHGGPVAGAFLDGTVHEASDEFQSAIRSSPALLALWEGLTPLGRNEFICWVDDAKQPTTRRRRIERTCEELLEGKKRPCCWAGCIHRADKAPSRWQQAVLIEKDAKKHR